MHLDETTGTVGNGGGDGLSIVKAMRLQTSLPLDTSKLLIVYLKYWGQHLEDQLTHNKLIGTQI